MDAELDKEVRVLHRQERRLINLLRNTPFGEVTVKMVKGLPEFVVKIENKIKLSD